MSAAASRRGFLTTLSAAAAALACRRADDGAGSPLGTGKTGDTGPVPVRCLDPVEGGTLARVAPFVGEPPRALETKTGAGLDARWVLDLTTLEDDDLVLPLDRLFVRTEAPLDLAARVAAGWTVRLGGLVDEEVDVDIDEILTQVVDRGPVHLECSGNTEFGGFGLQGAVRWAGVPFAWFAEQVTPTAEAALVRITGHDAHPPPTGGSTAGAAWVFRPEDLERAFLATHADDAPLDPDHGAPIRLIVPGWYGCTCIKWVEEIAWVGVDEPATSQMQEFASRTMQDGTPALAADYVPAVNDPAAVPIRVEVWTVGDREQVRVVGLEWGGAGAPEGLRLWANGVDVGLVELCGRSAADGWGLWTARLPPRFSGDVRLTLTLDDRGVRTRRLDAEYYARTARV